MPLNLTPEQADIVNYRLSPGEVLKITAFAGTGKTTVLELFARNNPYLRILYLAFNRSVKEEAASRFPENVKCMTAHGLAYAKHGRRFRSRLTGGYKAKTVMEALDLPSYEDAQFVIQTLLNYLISNAPLLNEFHIPEKVFDHLKNKKIPKESFSDTREQIVKNANLLWYYMLSGEHPEIGMLHDGYLKMYALDNPHLKNIDLIMVDEAQDINPVLHGIVFHPNNQGLSKILVGDSHQSIYGFRGAKDSLLKISGTQMYLTHSFRFDQNIAGIANLILKTFKGESRPIYGLKDNTGMGPFDEDQYTLIARTNAKIFDEAVMQDRKKKKIGFLGGIDGYRFHTIQDVYSLKHHDGFIIDPYIRSFDSYSELKSYAGAVEDKEIKWTCRIVDKYDKKIPELIDKIKKTHVPVEFANVILTTAHKAKGSEWNHVYMADDFPSLVDENEQVLCRTKMNEDEFNLQYVSVTCPCQKVSS